MGRQSCDSFASKDFAIPFPQQRKLSCSSLTKLANILTFHSRIFQVDNLQHQRLEMCIYSLYQLVKIIVKIQLLGFEREKTRLVKILRLQMATRLDFFACA